MVGIAGLPVAFFGVRRRRFRLAVVVTLMQLVPWRSLVQEVLCQLVYRGDSGAPHLVYVEAAYVVTALLQGRGMVVQYVQRMLVVRGTKVVR